jgi:predicted Zn-dependent protease
MRLVSRAVVSEPLELLAMRKSSCRGVAAAIFFIAAVWSWSGAAAQERGKRGETNGAFPFANPEQFFNQFFGEETEEERRAIQKLEISLPEERKFGDAAAQQYLEELKRQGIAVTDRGPEVEYLERLVETVRPQMQNAARYRRIKIYVADAKQTDARSFPGGTLIFYRGMLDFAENEAALVGVVGHELSHLDRGHQLLMLRRMKLAQSTFNGQRGFSPDQFMTTAAVMMRSFAKPFRPEDEAEADGDGALWAYHAGYDPREMARLFLAMHRREADKAPDQTPVFFRTHPFHMDRFRAVNDLYAELQKIEPKEKLYLGKINLERRIARSEKEFPEP